MLRAVHRPAGATVSCIASRRKECRVIRFAIAPKERFRLNANNDAKCVELLYGNEIFHRKLQCAWRNRVDLSLPGTIFSLTVLEHDKDETVNRSRLCHPGDQLRKSRRGRRRKHWKKLMIITKFTWTAVHVVRLLATTVARDASEEERWS